MNSTNRAVNRIILLIVGLLLIAPLALISAASLVPTFKESTVETSSAAASWAAKADSATRFANGSHVTWFGLGLFAAAVIVILFVIFVLSRLGGGRSRSVIRLENGSGSQGSVTISPKFAEDAITQALAERGDILSSRVESRRVKDTDVLHVLVTPRKNVSPAELGECVSKLVQNLSRLTGRENPALVTIHAGLRSKLSAEQSQLE